jgi:2-C-methyl-D-erythritol 4-phosphate cytidylyltransferase
MCREADVSSVNEKRYGVAGITKSQKVWALIIACGKSEQISPEADTAFLQIGDQPVLAYSLVAFERCREVDGIMVVAGKDRMDSVVGMARMYGTPKLKKIVGGAMQKTTSIKAALKVLLEAKAAMVVIHEASQPCVTPDVISELIKSAKRNGAATAGEKTDAPVAVVPKGTKVDQLTGTGTWLLHMPLAAKIDVLEKALGLEKDAGKVDDTRFSERIYDGASLVPITRPNVKIRTLTDLQMAAAALRT